MFGCFWQKLTRPIAAADGDHPNQGHLHHVQGQLAISWIKWFYLFVEMHQEPSAPGPAAFKLCLKGRKPKSLHEKKIFIKEIWFVLHLSFLSNLQSGIQKNSGPFLQMFILFSDYSINTFYDANSIWLNLNVKK